MSKPFILTILALIVLTALPVSATTITVAHGDPLDFYGYDTPTNQTEPFMVWIFGNFDSMYGVRGETNVDQYHVTIPAETITSLDVGTYDLYTQFTGVNRQFDISYTNRSLNTIYRNIESIDTSIFTPKMMKSSFDILLLTPPVDDVVRKHTVIIEEPSVKVKNMYTRIDGGLHMDLDTNLRAGDIIRAVIDEEIYDNTEYAKMMAYQTIVVGNDTRAFSLEFPAVAAEQLPAGKTHVISIHFLNNGVTTVPFKTYARYVEPTPTKVIEHYYDFNGELIGYDINTTRPAPVGTVTPAQEPYYETVLSDLRIDINNRTIPQRGTVFLGEKNLDVYGTLGWESWYRGYYVFTLQYCDSIEQNINDADTAEIVDSSDVIVINDPRHFFVDPDIFRNRTGAWCQHQTGLYEEQPPVAFFVERGGIHYNVTTKRMENILFNVSSIKVSEVLNLTANATPTQTLPWETNTTVITTATPEPIPTTESITVPLPWWIALMAVVGIVVVMRR